MKSKTNLGGAISVVGTALLGVGVLPQLSQLSPNSQILGAHQLAVLWYVALAGFILVAIGKGFTAYFSADASDVQKIQDQLPTPPSTTVDKPVDKQPGSE